MSDAVDTSTIITGDGGEPQGGTSGTELPQWVTSQLPADLHVEDLRDYVKPQDAIRAFLQTKEQLSGAIIKPGEDATEEELLAYRQKLGIPETADAYELAAENLPEGYDVDGALSEAFKAKAHEIGLTTEQAKALFDWHNDQTVSRLEQTKKVVVEETQQVREKLQQDWGEETYQKNARLISRLMQRYGSEELTSYLDETGLGNDPRFIQAFVGLAQAVAEDGIVTGEPGGKDASDTQKVLRSMYPRMHARMDAERRSAG